MASNRRRAPSAAVIAALEAENTDLKMRLHSLQVRHNELLAATIELKDDTRHLTEQQRRMQRCKRLNAQGTPCEIHRGVLRNSRTHEVIE